MSTMRAITWAFELKECDPLQRLAAIYFACVCGANPLQNVVAAEVSISEFAEWAGCDNDIAEVALASLEDFEGIEAYREQDAGFEITLSFEPARTPVPVGKDQLLRRTPLWLYVIATDRAVKVGISRNPAQRFKGFKTSIPDGFTVRLLGKGEHHAVVQAEGRCHQALRDYRITGEWFSCPPGEALRFARAIMGELKIQEISSE